MGPARKTKSLGKAGAVVVEAELVLSDYVDGLVLATIPVFGVAAYAYLIENAEQRAFIDFAFQIAYLRRDGKLERALKKTGVRWWWRDEYADGSPIDAIDAALHPRVERARDLPLTKTPVLGGQTQARTIRIAA